MVHVLFIYTNMYVYTRISIENLLLRHYFRVKRRKTTLYYSFKPYKYINSSPAMNGTGHAEVVVVGTTSSSSSSS